MKTRKTIYIDTLLSIMSNEVNGYKRVGNEESFEEVKNYLIPIASELKKDMKNEESKIKVSKVEEIFKNHIISEPTKRTDIIWSIENIFERVQTYSRFVQDLRLEGII